MKSVFGIASLPYLTKLMLISSFLEIHSRPFYSLFFLVSLQFFRILNSSLEKCYSFWQISIFNIIFLISFNIAIIKAKILFMLFSVLSNYHINFTQYCFNLNKKTIILQQIGLKYLKKVIKKHLFYTINQHNAKIVPSNNHSYLFLINFDTMIINLTIILHII